MSEVASHHRLIQSQHVITRVHGTSAVGRLNGRIAVAATTVLSSVWFFWFCVLLVLVELPAVFAARSVIAWVMYISQTVIQLLALPLLGAGQRIISAAQDARAETDHDTLVTLHGLSVQQIQILEGQNEVLDLLRKGLRLSAPRDRAPRPRVAQTQVALNQAPAPRDSEEEEANEPRRPLPGITRTDGD